jgi:hypothetical protein
VTAKARVVSGDDLPPNLLITVCAECLQASCWQGEFYCQKFKTANIIDLTVKRLRALALESPHYWAQDPRAEHWRKYGEVGR